MRLGIRRPAGAVRLLHKLIEAVLEMPLMSSTSEQDRSTVRRVLESTGTAFSLASYEPNAALFRQGDPCDRVMHIERGSVRLAVTGRSGKEAICGILGDGAFLGEEALAGHAVRRHTATAMTATEVLVVGAKAMLRLLHAHQALSDRLIAHVLARETRLEADLTNQLLYCSEQRLARTLLVLAAYDERRRQVCPLPDVRQEIIAEMVGTTRSRVNVLLTKFKRLGHIEEDHGVLLVKPSLVRVASEDGGADRERRRELASLSRAS